MTSTFRLYIVAFVAVSAVAVFLYWLRRRLAFSRLPNDWKDFVRDVPYDVPKGIGSVASTDPFIPSARFQGVFPKLAELLATARRTVVSTSAGQFFLFGWTGQDGRSFGWLSPGPTAQPRRDLHPHHRLLLEEFGGIAAIWHEPEDTWLLNLNSALVERPAVEGLEGWFTHYADRCREENIQPEVDPANYVPFAIEANGNLTLYHRQHGDVMLFAHDHDFDYVLPLGRAPELTLYRLKGIATLQDWIETVAGQWARHVSR